MSVPNPQLPDPNASAEAADAAHHLHDATEHLKKANEQLERTPYDEPKQWDSAMGAVRQAQAELDEATDELETQAKRQAEDESKSTDA